MRQLDKEHANKFNKTKLNCEGTKDLDLQHERIKSRSLYGNLRRINKNNKLSCQK